FKGIPAIVVGAGPSLIKSLDFIRENMHRALIVAVDTSYKILLDNGIVPHFCIAVDPQIINARYLEGTGETTTVLVADPTVHPSIPRFFKGPMVMTGVAFDMMKWIESALLLRGELAHGGSVSTNAYDFARQTGASPVILVGQDLSFTSGLAHARGAYLDEQMYKRINRFNTPQMFNRKQLSFMPKIMVPGKNNYPVHSNSKMMIFINWFENRKDPSLINASADGVFIKGIKNIGSNEIFFNKSTVSIQDIIDNLIHAAAKSRRDENSFAVLKKADEMLAEIEELIPVLEKGIRFGADLKEMLKSGKDKSDPGKMGYIIKKLSETDAFIESRTKAGPMISFSIQRIIHSITEGYGTGDVDNAGARSEFLYKGMLEGALFSKKVLGKMKVLLVNQA
ncbi:MAG: 6-hydroxymethylpterin diphosphokinase MptE-like protein, partial [Spirochaetota bacterium]